MRNTTVQTLTTASEADTSRGKQSKRRAEAEIKANKTDRPTGNDRKKTDRDRRRQRKDRYEFT